MAYFEAAAAANEERFFQPGIGRLASAQRAITSCLSKPDKRIWLAVGRLDVSVLRAVDCKGLLQPGQHVLPGLVQRRIVLHRSQLATDVLDLLTRLLLVRDHQGRHSWLDTPRAPAQLQVVADLLNILTYMWRTVAESNRVPSLEKLPVDRHDEDRIVSMVSGGNTCSVLSQGMVCMQHSSNSSGSSTHRDQALVDVANAAAVAAATLLYLVAACPTAFCAVVDIATPPLHMQACKVIALRRTGRRVGYFDMAACQLACAVSSCCDDMLDQYIDQSDLPYSGVAALLGRDPAVCGALLDTLDRSLSVLLPSGRGRIVKGLLEPEPPECVACARGAMDFWLLQALRSVFAASGWALAPVTSAHITALVRHKQHVTAEYVLECTCAAAVKLLPHVQPPNAFPFAFQQALGLVKSAAQHGVGQGYGYNADEVISQLNELMAQAAKRPLNSLFRAKCILDEGLLADCEHMLRQTWRQNVTQPRLDARHVAEATVYTTTCEGLCRLAAHLMTAVAFDRDAALHRAAADAVLSAVATVSKVLCYVARTAGAQQHQLWLMASTPTVGCPGAEGRSGRSAAEPRASDCEVAAASRTGVDSLLAVAGNGTGATVDSTQAQAAPGECTEAGLDTTQHDTKAAAGEVTEAATGHGAGAGMDGAEVGVEGIQAAAGESRGTTSAARAAQAAAAAAEVAPGEGRGIAAAAAATTAESYARAEHADGGAAAAPGREGISSTAAAKTGRGDAADADMQVEEATAHSLDDAPKFRKQHLQQLLDRAPLLQDCLSGALSIWSVLLQGRGGYRWCDHVVHCAALQLLPPTVHLVRHVPASDASAAAAVLSTLTSHLQSLHVWHPTLEYPPWWSMLADPFAFALDRVLCHVEMDQPSQPWQQQQPPLREQQQQQQPSPQEQQLQGRFKALMASVTGLALLSMSAGKRNDLTLQRFLQQLLQPALASRIDAAMSTAEYAAWLGSDECPAAMTSVCAAWMDEAGAVPSLVEVVMSDITLASANCSHESQVATVDDASVSAVAAAADSVGPETLTPQDEDAAPVAACVSATASRCDGAAATVGDADALSAPAGSGDGASAVTVSAGGLAGGRVGRGTRAGSNGCSSGAGSASCITSIVGIGCDTGAGGGGCSIDVGSISCRSSAGSICCSAGSGSVGCSSDTTDSRVARGLLMSAHLLKRLRDVSTMHGSQQTPTGAAEPVSWDRMALATADVHKDDTRSFCFFGCWYRGCTNLDGGREADLPLGTCGGCHLARYCSESCQRRAWRAGHRAACVSWQEGKTRSRLPSDVAAPSSEHRQSETAQ